MAYELKQAECWALASGKLGGPAEMVVCGFEDRESATEWLLDYLVGIERAQHEAQLAAMSQMPLKVQ